MEQLIRQTAIYSLSLFDYYNWIVLELAQTVSMETVWVIILIKLYNHHRHQHK